MLVVFSGLPGVGKTTLAGATAARLSAAFVRIDGLDSALRRAGIRPEQPIGPATYSGTRRASWWMPRGRPRAVSGGSSNSS